MPKQSFERRTFLKLMSTGIGAGLINLPQLSRAITSPLHSSHFDFVLGKAQWSLHEDGTFDIHAGTISLTRCRPTINGQSIFVRNIFMGDSPKGKRIIYEIEGGYVMLDLRTNSNMISIGTELSGMKNAPVWVSPLGEGYLTGANRFFRQGLGTGGQSGIFELRKSTQKKSFSYPDEEAWSYDSFLMSGLIAENGDTLSIGSFEQNNFIQRSSVFNRPRRKGLNDARFGDEALFFESGFATENILLKDEFLKLPDLFIYHGNQPYGTMQNLAWSISEQNEARRDTDTNYFWTSSQDFKTAFTYKDLTEQLKFLDEIKPAIPLKAIVIGAGYCIPGDWHDTLETWPKSMNEAARLIFQRRYRAGIYVAPFVVHEKSRVFRNHSHWILKDKAGELLVKDEDANGKLYALDGSLEDVKDHIAKVFKNFQQMGFTYYELDHLDWGLNDASEYQLARKGKSSVQTFRAVMERIRTEIGAGTFVTANNTPYSPIIGFVDAVRIDCDQSWKWDDQITGHILQESYNTQYFNNVFWQNDPDVVFLRNYKSEFTDNEQKSLALWAGFMGGSVGISDDFKSLQKEKMQLWRFIEPIKRPQSAILPFWGSDVKNKVAVKRLKKEKAWAVLVLNDTAQTVSETYQINELIGENDAWVFVWEPGFSLGLGKGSRLTVLLSSHESKLYYLSQDKENPDLNLSLSGLKTTE